MYGWVWSVSNPLVNTPSIHLPLWVVDIEMSLLILRFQWFRRNSRNLMPASEVRSILTLSTIEKCIWSVQQLLYPPPVATSIWRHSSCMNCAVKLVSSRIHCGWILPFSSNPLVSTVSGYCHARFIIFFINFQLVWYVMRPMFLIQNYYRNQKKYGFINKIWFYR